MPNYYNIALLPVSEAVNQAFTAQAQSVKSYSDGYLLGEAALPHITVSQFTLEEGGTTDDVWSQIARLTPPRGVRITEMQIREGMGIHEGFDWAQWAVEKDPTLLAFRGNPL